MSLTLDAWPVKQGLRLGYLNINSAINKKDDIAAILQNNGQGFHLFGFAESRLSSKISDSDMHMPGYDVLRLDLGKPKRTGLLVYVASVLKYKRLVEFEQYNVECIWLEVILKNSKPIILGFIYRNPAEKMDWEDNFNSLMDDVTLLSLETILFGDFNIDLLKPKLKWKQNYTVHGLEQLIDKPTRITEDTSTLIDHIYTNTKRSIIEICSPCCSYSDHNPVCVTWHKSRAKIPKIGHKTIQYRCFKNFKESDFLADLANSQLDQIFQIRDPDVAATFWINTFFSVYDKHAPFIPFCFLCMATG